MHQARASVIRVSSYTMGHSIATTIALDYCARTYVDTIILGLLLQESSIYMHSSSYHYHHSSTNSSTPSDLYSISPIAQIAPTVSRFPSLAPFKSVTYSSVHHTIHGLPFEPPSSDSSVLYSYTFSPQTSTSTRRQAHSKTNLKSPLLTVLVLSIPYLYLFQVSFLFLLPRLVVIASHGSYTQEPGFVACIMMAGKYGTHTIGKKKSMM